MSSAILTIYNELAATSITVNGTAVGVKDADELPNVLSSADCPVRLLTPIFQFGGGLEIFSNAENIWLAAQGSMPKMMNWVLYDVMLWKPVAMDIGVKAHAKELIAYCAKYYDMISVLSLTNVTRCEVAVTPEVIEYPVGSDHWFWGVRTVLRIQEKWN